MEWIPVTERMPENEEIVAIRCVRKNCGASWNRAYFGTDGFWHGSGSFADVTHWMPIDADPDAYIAAAPWNSDRNRYCCEKCGAYIGKYDKYCNGCGRRLTDWTPDGRGKR